MTPAGEKLDALLVAAIDELKPPTQTEAGKMRGIARLANASKNLMQSADQVADAAAQKLEAAYAKQMAVAKQYDQFADEVVARADEALDNLNQIANLPPPESDKEPSK